MYKNYIPLCISLYTDQILCVLDNILFIVRKCDLLVVLDG